MKSDSQLKLDVMAELAWDASISTPRIEVIVRHGVVTLIACVEDRVDKCAIERAIRRVAGDVKVVYVMSAGAAAGGAVDALRATLHAWARGSARPMSQSHTSPHRLAGRSVESAAPE